MQPSGYEPRLSACQVSYSQAASWVLMNHVPNLKDQISDKTIADPTFLASLQQQLLSWCPGMPDDFSGQTAAHA